MIHIATVHWLDETWVNVQLNYFERYLKGHPHKFYAFLNGIEPDKYYERFHYISTEPIVAHATKLNLLADKICADGAEDDLIYFIDGDAFPVGDIQKYVALKLKKKPLVAIQRLENEGDPQPHPSFCATTIGFWKEIKGDWRQGPQWVSSSGKLRTDTGGILWAKLKKEQIVWSTMLRSNRINLHPLWFGLYEDLIYHHGAAFRTPYCVVDIHEARSVWWKRWLLLVGDSNIGKLKNGWVQNAIYSYVMKKRIQQSINDSRTVLKAIKEDPDFYLQFTGAGKNYSQVL